jgi:hypothetical protein
MSKNDKALEMEEDEEFHKFMVTQGLVDYREIPVEKVVFSKGIKAAFWFLRIYIILMVLLVVIGFSHVV